MNRTPGVALALAALVSLGAAAAPFPSSIPIPDDFAPEGIAVGDDRTFYVGSLWDGDIYTGNLRRGDGRILVDREPPGQGASPPGTPPGMQATGMRVERNRDRLWVAGGLSGRIFAYDTQSGAELADVAVAAPGAATLNDLVVTSDAVYVTDSTAPRLLVVPLSPKGAPGSSHTLWLTGPAAADLGFPGLNGIDATAKGDQLVVGHTLLGGLYTVDPVTGVSAEIVLPPGAVPPGVSDGVILRGDTAWVVENFINTVVELRLAPDLSSGSVVRVHDNGSVGGLFRIPTTMGLSGKRLVVVNARFDMGLPPPFGVGAPPGTDYDVVQIPRR